MQPTILIANRGEIAIRIARACEDLGMASVAVHSTDDADSLHVRLADRAVALPGSGAAAYLSIADLVAAGLQAGCTAVHPGYGFLSESAQFARACADAGLRFIGPAPDALQMFGDKASARQAAERADVPVLAGTPAPVSVEQASAFFRSLDGRGMMIKAVAGGGGRGMRLVREEGEIARAHASAAAEARSAFGCGDLYCEELIADARHIEVQILGDGQGGVMHFGERECSLQRRRQKVVEIAPSPSLDESLRQSIVDAALRMAREAAFLGLGTFEFLVDRRHPKRFIFIETNPRLQVEHTITEEVWGVDLVQAQIRVCLGATLADLQHDWGESPRPRGHAVQLRINMETMRPDGSVLPASGQLRTYEMPAGPGVRVDGFGYAGYRTSTRFDSLLAKLVVHSRSPDFADTLQRARRALRETHIGGVNTNIGYLAAVLERPEVIENDVSTTWLDEHASELANAAARAAAPAAIPSAEASTGAGDGAGNATPPAPPGAVPVRSPVQGSLLALTVQVGDLVRAGQQLAVVEAMKMQHAIEAAVAGVVRAVPAQAGTVIQQDGIVAYLEPMAVGGDSAASTQGPDPDHIRPDLAESIAAHALTLDAARPDAIARRHAKGHRSARENIAAVLDDGSFVEYGALALAAQRGRHPLEELRRSTPADGIVCGFGTVNAAAFGAEEAHTFIAAYDYTVLAGTQGTFNHRKQDRLFALAAQHGRPLVLFAEGGGGRPGDTDKALVKVASLDIPTFKAFASLSGQVPTVGIANGRCFAGNAALLGCCDTIIATRGANIGMGGPAMVEGGGLGAYRPEEIGPASVQAPNGVIDLLVEDEQQAAAAARQYLSYFQGRLPQWECADQRLLRHAVPENRLRAYDVRKIVTLLADTGSVLELRRDFGRAMVTAFARLQGRPVGILANNPMHLGGAIDADAADKAARFMALCDAHKIPLLSLCDTPGFMVGPQAEQTAQVRHVSRMFVHAAALRVPLVMVVLRKGYGLGAMAMSGGNFQDTAISLAWPTGEFGGMGLEGAVRLGFRKELEAIADAAQREAEFGRRVAQAYEHGKALNMAAMTEIDDVIDPSRTRECVAAALQSAARVPARRERFPIDTW
jgi:acetyl/propionyl-CoA carboxylase alpha subunit